jgi:hypothetical protein
MNWRRGILLAGINLAVAVPLIIMLEVRDEASIREDRDDHAPPAWIASDPVLKTAPSGDEGQTVGFDPCTMTIDYSTQHQVEQSLEPFAVALSGWQQVCPPRWSIAGRLKVNYDFVQAPSTVPARREVGLGFGLLIAVQWILVGGFPLIRPKRWWAEPGAFITCCALIAYGLVFMRPIAELARVPIAFTALAWLWWFGLLVWTGVRFGWKRFVRRSA